MIHSWSGKMRSNFRHARDFVVLPIRYLILVVGSLLLSEVRAAENDAGFSYAFGLEAGEHSVGFQLFDLHDPSRVITAGGASSPQPRPMRTYLWYPAKNAARPMRLGRYAALADEDIWPAQIAPGLREKLNFAHGPLARSLNPAALEALLQRPVRAVENAKALAGPFPLIVIGQGLYYESPVAFAALSEYLAGRGMVVVTTPLVGTNSPFVKLDPQDLETQVRDLEFVLAHARRLSFVSADKLGVLGFDMGGMAGLILAMRNRDVDAFVSLDSGILYEHPSGLPRTSADYDPLALRVPWLHATANEMRSASDSDVQSLFEGAAYSERYLLLAPDLGHVDFTTYGLIDGRSAALGYWAASTPTGVASQPAISRYVFDFFATFLAPDAERRSFPSQPPDDSEPALRTTLEHRAATLRSITYDEFVQAILAGRIEEAIRELRAAAAVGAHHVLLEDSHFLERIAYRLAFSWGLREEAVRVIEFDAELHPTSARAQSNLAETYVALQNYPAAIDAYSRYLEQHPSDTRVQSRLDEADS